MVMNNELMDKNKDRMYFMIFMIVLIPVIGVVAKVSKEYVADTITTELDTVMLVQYSDLMIDVDEFNIIEENDINEAK